MAMNIHTELPDHLDHVDVVIAGAGSAGCIIAARLASADPAVSILVLEEGPDNIDPIVQHPVFFGQHLIGLSGLSHVHMATTSSGQRQVAVPTGAVLGGGSSVNVAIYSRGQASDYDAWQMPGWSAAELMPFFRRFETYHGPGAAAVHGHDGPIHVSDGGFRVKRAQESFISTAEALGIQRVADVHPIVGASGNAVSTALRYVGLDGRRQDAASTFLRPRLADGKHPNLHVVVQHRVKRVVFDETKRAVGVECAPATSTTSTTSFVRVRRLVVISSGALGSAAILERSGVGDPAVLARAGVPVVEDLPGVGRNYQDHNGFTCSYLSDLAPDESLDALWRHELTPQHMVQNSHPMLGWNGCDASAKIRPTDHQVAALGPDFQAAWDASYKNVPDRPAAICNMITAGPIMQCLPPGQQGWTFACLSVYPHSRGHVHITGPDAPDDDRLDINAAFYADPRDLQTMAWTYKRQREIARRMPIFRGEVAASHPPFAPGSKAACASASARGPPPPHQVRDIEYSDDDDAVLERWVRENVVSFSHSLGTCKMAPRDQMGVVDEKLNVYGVHALKVADMSIPPSGVAAHTNNTALMIGEKAADMIIKELAGE